MWLLCFNDKLEIGHSVILCWCNQGFISDLLHVVFLTLVSIALLIFIIIIVSVNVSMIPRKMLLAFEVITG